MADLYVGFLDVGQGDCTFVKFPDGTTMLVDCGSIKGASQGANALQAIGHYLQGTHIDQLVLTHGDCDHYNLLRYLVRDGGITFGQICYGNSPEAYKNDRENDYTYDLIQGRQSVLFGQVIFDPTTNPPAGDMLWPIPYTHSGVDIYLLAANCALSTKDTNANSIVLALSYQGSQIYLMGDSTSGTEEFILESFKNLKGPWDARGGNNTRSILKAGHHGSNTSTAADWMAKANPDVIVVSSDTKTWGKAWPGQSPPGIPPQLKYEQFRKHIDQKQPFPDPQPGVSDLRHNFLYFNSDAKQFQMADVGLKPLCSTVASIYVATRTNQQTGIQQSYPEYIGSSWWVDINDDGSVVYGWTGVEV